MAAASFVTYLPQMMPESCMVRLVLSRAEEVFCCNYIYMRFFYFHGMISTLLVWEHRVTGAKRWLPYAIPLFLIYLYIRRQSCMVGCGSFGNRRMVGSTPLLYLV